MLDRSGVAWNHATGGGGVTSDKRVLTVEVTKKSEGGGVMPRGPPHPA